jgi:hypothetical protein
MEQLEMRVFAAIVAANTTWHEINVIAQKCWGMLAGNIANITWNLACPQNMISSYLKRFCRSCVIIRAGILPICETEMVPYQNHNHFVSI